MQGKILTGCKGIDRILSGGISLGHVSLVYGEAETGKTTLAIQLAVNCAKQGSKTLFMDCDGEFSANRLSQIASTQFEKVAELVVLVKPNSFKEQGLIIDRLGEYLTKGFGLLVIDTVTSLYRLEIAESPSKAFELNRELNRQVAYLAQVARTQRIAVLMVSQVRTAFKDDYVTVEPVATRVLKFWAETIIDIKPSEVSSVVKLVVEKSIGITQPMTYAMKLVGSGMVECSLRQKG